MQNGICYEFNCEPISSEIHQDFNVVIEIKISFLHWINLLVPLKSIVFATLVLWICNAYKPYARIFIRD